MNKKQLLEKINKLPQTITTLMLTETTQKNSSFWCYQRRAGKLHYSKHPTFKRYSFEKEDVIEWVKKEYKVKRKKRTPPIEQRLTWWERVRNTFVNLIPPS